MIVRQYIKEFEKLGLGMFVHFGLYSVLGKGEWAKKILNIADEDYEVIAEQFSPKADWAKNLVRTAKLAGCKYITLTTRHHDGFSLYDTCGLSDYDTVHTKCGRDLVKEFVEECRKEDIIPFFYHTLLDWREESYQNDFSKYLEYLRASIEILCKNYGKIGGLWFDGMWDKKEADWEEDKLYSLIRKYQPEAMIINNTGLQARGELGHVELDSVTFERGVPQKINQEDARKYIASEMCEIFGRHWGYAKEDFNYKSPAQIICELTECRKYGSNMLLNIGPMGDGSIRLIDQAMLSLLGGWCSYFNDAIRTPRPCGVEVENKSKDFLLKDGKNYYLFCYDLPMNEDLVPDDVSENDFRDIFEISEKIQSITWMDNGDTVDFKQDENKTTVYTVPFSYGRDLVVRVAKISCE